MDDETPVDAPATTTWEAHAATALGAEPLLVVAARSERTVPTKGPVMLAVAAGRIAVIAGERNDAPAVDAPATVIWFADVVRPPMVRPRKHGATIELHTANADVRLAAPLETLHAIVDAFRDAPARARELPAPRTSVARPSTGRMAPPTAIARPLATVAAPPTAAVVPEMLVMEEAAATVPTPSTIPEPAAPPARTPVGYDVRDGLLVPRRLHPAPEE
jgi:hypothetical protein